jgi:hypothetical protein
VNVSDVAARAWAFRYRVEVEAALRFDALASQLSAFDGGSPVIAMLRAAAEDERRHVELCRALAAQPLTTPSTLPAIAPEGTSPRDVVLYEMIAACCIAETESVATLMLLLEHPMRDDIAKVVREIAGDEVRHAKMGWAHLAREAATRQVAFAGAWLPAMLEGSIAEGFDAPGGDELYTWGVLPPDAKRVVFDATLKDVVVPGLAHCGVDTAPALDWMSRR